MDYRNIFDAALNEAAETAHLPDDDRFIRIVKERTNSMKTKKVNWKKPAAVAASIAAAAALTVSVGAALNWDFNTAFGSVFTHRDESLPESQEVHFTEKYDESIEIQFIPAANTYTANGFDYTRYGKELDLSFEGDGFTVNYKGMMGEGRVLYVLYDVVFDEDTDFAPKEGYSEWNPVFELDTPDGLGREFGDTLIHSDGSTYSYCGKMIAADDISGNMLTIKGIGLWRERFGSLKYSMDETDFERLECDFYTEIPIDMEAEVPGRTIELNEPITVYDFVPNDDGSGFYSFKAADSVLYDITITPFTCTGSIETNGRVFGKAEAYDLGSFVFTFRDGTTLTETNVSSDDTFFFDFDRPVEPDDIVSVTIGDKTIALD